MPRLLKPCGTEAAYRRHRRAGEAACAACSAAHRDSQLTRDRAVAVVPLAILPAPTTPAPVQALEQARWALTACTTAIGAGAPGLVGLLREHSRLVELIVKLEAADAAVELPVKPRALDVLAERREARRSFDPRSV